MTSVLELAEKLVVEVVPVGQHHWRQLLLKTSMLV